MKIVNAYSVNGVCEAFGLAKKSYKSVDLFRLMPVGTIVVVQYNVSEANRLTDLTSDYGTIVVFRAGNNYSAAIYFATYNNETKVMSFAASGDSDWHTL